MTNFMVIRTKKYAMLELPEAEMFGYGNQFGQ
jgi:hypothetical protein